jgi:hypothetical protein
MGHIFLYISANFFLLFKGPWPFKSQKTHFSGLTTQYAPRLNLGPSTAKKHYSGWVIAWIFFDSGRNFFRSRIIYNNCNKKNTRNTVHSSFCGFFDAYCQRKTYEVPTRYHADTGEDTVKSA